MALRILVSWCVINGATFDSSDSKVDTSILKKLWNAKVSFIQSSRRSWWYAPCAVRVEIQGFTQNLRFLLNLRHFLIRIATIKAAIALLLTAIFHFSDYSLKCCQLNVAKCMLHVASTMLPATCGQQHVAVECCPNVA